MQKIVPKRKAEVEERADEAMTIAGVELGKKEDEDEREELEVNK